MDDTLLVEKVKKRIGLNGSEKHDVFLYEVAPDILEYAKMYTNNSFTVAGVEKIPGPVIQFVAKACEFNMHQVGLKNRKMGEVSYTYNSEFPQHIKDLLKMYRKVRLRG